MHRLTADVRRQLLELNDGFTQQTSYAAKNFREHRTYTIVDGQLQIRSTGKTSWADSGFEHTWIADAEETHRFLYNHQGLLDQSQVVVNPQPRIPRAAPASVEGPAAVVGDGDSDGVDVAAANIRFLSQLTPAQRLLFLAAVAAAAVGVYAAFRWGPTLWTNRVKPAAARWRTRVRRDHDDEPG